MWETGGKTLVIESTMLPSVGSLTRSQEQQTDTIGKFVQQSTGDPRERLGFCDPSGSGERQETYLWASEQRAHLCHLVLAPNQRCEGDGRMALLQPQSEVQPGGARQPTTSNCGWPQAEPTGFDSTRSARLSIAASLRLSALQA